jgi:hypothetical protein
VTAILTFLKMEAAFSSETTHAMSVAFDDVCQALKLTNRAEREREVIALRIIELARRGEHDAVWLRERVLREASSSDRSG